MKPRIAFYDGEPHDIILHTRTESAEFDVIITPDMLDLVASQIIAMRKKINKEPTA